ncbi:MAG: nitrilase family protein [Bacteroidales bacterium]|jgi:predicted amidohydrolase|nr:nitrilase family protein [Bacteroidales bacterium]
MQSEHLNIHVVQFSPEWGEIDATLDKLEMMIRGGAIRAPQADDAPQLIVLPEMFSTGFKFRSHLAETMEGKTVQWMKRMAGSLNSAIYGSALIGENGKTYNRGMFVYPDGNIIQYDKAHLFCLSDEPQHITPGTNVVTAEYAGWRLRLSICYDLRFPIWNRNTFKDGIYDYDVYMNIASWDDSRAHVWRTLLHARAIENMAYTIGANRVGVDGDNYTYRGDSMVIDAKGTAIGMSNPNEEQIISVQLNKTLLTQFRQKFCVATDWDTYEITG